jgi:prepilin-type N-terminal cleavage/methylation domain-containing protein
VTRAGIRDRICGRDREGGFTITEVLVALVILGVAVVSIVGAMGTSIVLSDRHRQSVTADALVRTYAERLNKVNYVACAPATQSQYQAGPTGMNLPIPTGFTVSLVSIQYWNGDGNATTPPTFTSTRATCQANGDKGLQQITIQAKSNNNRGSQQLTVLKRQP